jgi:hydrogenase maturation protease
MSQPAHPQHILIACIGNIFFGDDGFGVEVARRLLNRPARPYAAQVQVEDFGIRGLDLAYTLLDGIYDTLVLVDAIPPRSGEAGTLHLIEPDLSQLDVQGNARTGQLSLDAHSMDPLKVLALARSLGAPPIRTLLLGCEASNVSATASEEEMSMGLSQPVQAAVDEAMKMLDTLVARLLYTEASV